MRDMRGFDEDQKWSRDAGHEAFWQRVYAKAFTNIDEVRPGYLIDEQRAGIDRVIVLANGNSIRVDEKKRRGVWSDVLLETVSNVERGTPGWMEKDLAIDFLAYAFMPIYRVYFFQWQMLRRAWEHYRQEWMDRYPVRHAFTEISPTIAYRTASIAIPIKVLQAAVARAAVIDAPPDEPPNNRPALGLERQLEMPFRDEVA